MRMDTCVYTCVRTCSYMCKRVHIQDCRQNTVFHAEGEQAPRGVPARPTSGAISDDDGDISDDDDKPDPVLDNLNYYKIPPQQKQFNKKHSSEFLKQGANSTSCTVIPADILKSGCNADLISVGTLHICALHIFLVLPLPPCPYNLLVISLLCEYCTCVCVRACMCTHVCVHACVHTCSREGGAGGEGIGDNRRQANAPKIQTHHPLTLY